MAIISRTYGYLFIESPRTGSTAIARGVLLPHLDGERIPPEDIRDENGRVIVIARHCSLPQLIRHDLVKESELSDLFVFTAIRNPFDSIVSDYCKRASELQKKLDQPNAWIHRDPNTLPDMEYAQCHTFPEWVEHRFTERSMKTLWRRRPVHPRHMNAGQLKRVSNLMRFESLQEDFARVLDGLGIGPEHREIPADHVTQSRQGRHYREFYDSRSRKIIEHVYAPDIDRFGYAF